MVQGTFVEAAAPAPVSLHLATAVLQLLSSKVITSHPQPYTRRAAIVTASQVHSIGSPCNMSCCAGCFCELASEKAWPAALQQLTMISQAQQSVSCQHCSG